MARPGFKRLCVRFVPPEIERGTFVLFASLALALVCWQWRPLPQPVWSVDSRDVAVGPGKPLDCTRRFCRTAAAII